MARVLIDMGADPKRRNDLGLCWNDVASHFIPIVDQLASEEKNR